jgi:hypothetical protein
MHLLLIAARRIVTSFLAQAPSPTTLAFLASVLCASANASPLPTRDQNPLLGGFGLPGALDARGSGTKSALSVELNWASTALIQTGSDEFLIVDAETRELRLSFARSFTERWSFELQVPYRNTSGGNLDGFIDNWHDVFGLPEGARRIQPDDRLRLHYWKDGVTLIETGAATEGLADASLSMQYALHSSNTAAVSAALAVKLPTGKDHWLNSSGATDVSAILAAERRFGERWTFDGQLAATWLGEGELLPRLQREFVWSGRAGISWHATPSLAFTLQMDGHSRVFDSELDFFSESLVATLGGNYRFGSGWMFSIGVSEDIMIEHSPDVVFVFGLRKAGGE